MMLCSFRHMQLLHLCIPREHQALRVSLHICVTSACRVSISVICNMSWCLQLLRSRALQCIDCGLSVGQVLIWENPNTLKKKASVLPVVNTVAKHRYRLSVAYVEQLKSYISSCVAMIRSSVIVWQFWELGCWIHPQGHWNQPSDWLTDWLIDRPGTEQTDIGVRRTNFLCMETLDT